MLDELTAVNLGLIAEASIRVPSGLTVLTGETGTGKTVMLGALRLIRGDTAHKGSIGPAGPTCDVAARFVDGDTETVLRRTIAPDRSRAYIDGVASPAAALADLSDGRIEIVGQHDQLSITKGAGVRRLVDRMLDADGMAAKASYRASWDAYQGVLEEIAVLGSDMRELERERDFLAHQVEEIDRADLEPDEEHDLRTRVVRMRNADALIQELDATLTALADDAIGDNLGRAIAALRAATRFDESLEPLVDRLEATATEINEVAGSIARTATDLDTDAEALATVEDRLAELAALKRRYGDSIEDVLTFRKDAAERVDRLSTMLEAAEDVDARLARARTTLDGAGEALRAHRAAAAATIVSNAVEHLRDLGFSDPLVDIGVTPREPAKDGSDRLVIHFASDAALDPGPVSSIASGGELSRLVLALTLASGASDADVIAFDEIDAGVGGTTALELGRKLATLSAGRQVICVTHLPQVAAFATAHFAVERSGTSAGIRPIHGEERLEELSRMLAGLGDSDSGRDHAKELMEIAANRQGPE